MSATRTSSDITTLAIHTLKMLAVDAVEAAQSGHPGSPMGQADVAYVLWTKFLRHWPADPLWPGRDRFVLSAGHGSMLLYGLLHLTGYDLPLDELKRFRQWGSHTPGHPELGHTPGVETTTGPLGQGVGNAVGMAIAQKMAAARYGDALCAGRVFGICSDGDVMEGVSHEAGSLAGHLGLGDLILVYDDNHITIEGDTALAFSEDVGKRFEAYGWHVQKIDGHDHAAIFAALSAATAETGRPSLICARTHIANGAPHAVDTAEAHGAPLGADEVKATKEALGWPLSPTFLVPPEALEHWRASAERNRAAYEEWQATFAAWRTAEPAQAAQWDDARLKRVPDDLETRLLKAVEGKADATRVLGSLVLQEAGKAVPWLVGGSADLDPSTKTAIKGAGSIARGQFGGRVFHFGIREHGMGSLMNGLALSEWFTPLGSTFLIFSDYMRPPMRLAALMERQVVYVFTHDSIFLGEDGPTHQPIEQLWALRAIPNFELWRPADGAETAIAWAAVLRRTKGPSALALTRQKLPALPAADPALIARGAYELVPGGPLTIVATGSEVALAVAAAAELGARVVSMPCVERFLAQDEGWRSSVLPPSADVVTIEAGRTPMWGTVTQGRPALHLGIDRFGASAPAAELAKQFGFTAPAVVERVKAWLAG
jgi:transketolase